MFFQACVTSLWLFMSLQFVYYVWAVIMYMLLIVVFDGHEWIRKKYSNKQGIGIAEKRQETRRDRWGGNVTTNSYLTHWSMHNHLNRDLWFTLPPQWSFLVSRPFLLAILILCLNILFFIILGLMLTLHKRDLVVNLKMQNPRH